MVEIGKKYNYLTAIKFSHKGNKSKNYYLFKCDCEKEKVIESYAVESGDIVSCGCYKNSKKQYIELKKYNKLPVGTRFNNLVIVEYLYHDLQRHSFYKVKCDCGNEKIVRRGQLITDRMKSCGCKRYDFTIKNRKPDFYTEKNKLYKAYEASARNRKLEFLLTFSDCADFFNKDCHYCGIPPSSIRKTPFGDEYKWNGIDRVDTNIGYKVSNCVTCCETCNKAKLCMSKKEFLNWITRVYNHSVKNNVIS